MIVEYRTRLTALPDLIYLYMSYVSIFVRERRKCVDFPVFQKKSRKKVDKYDKKSLLFSQGMITLNE